MAEQSELVLRDIHDGPQRDNMMRKAKDASRLCVLGIDSLFVRGAQGAQAAQGAQGAQAAQGAQGAQVVRAAMGSVHALMSAI